MKVYTFDGRQVKWKLNDYTIGHKPSQLCSQGHLQARELLVNLFPLDLILEEIPIPELGLTLDFFIPRSKIAVEIDGKQHYQHVPFFHKTKIDFRHAQLNDRRKTDWCELNNIKLVRLVSDQFDQWTSQILGSR